MHFFKSLFSSFAFVLCSVSLNGAIWEITQENFDEIIGSKKPVILDVRTSWCSACQMMEPIVDEMSERYEGQIAFAKLDLDAEGELVKSFDITSLPTFLFFKSGQKKPVMREVGALSSEEFEAKISQFLKKR